MEVLLDRRAQIINPGTPSLSLCTAAELLAERYALAPYVFYRTTQKGLPSMGILLRSISQQVL